jgi:polysaccharide export outer membrane protein
MHPWKIESSFQRRLDQGPGRRPPLWVLLALLSLFVSCSALRRAPVVMHVTDRPDPPAQPYVIGKDDVLSVVVWRQPQLSGQILVASDGTITVPLAGSMPAAGSTCEELRKELERRLTQVTLKPNVTVRVAEPRSRVFYALGEVHKPGMFPLHSDEVLSQALAEAGGLTDFADASAVKILRHTPSSDVEIIVNYNRIASGKDLGADTMLEPGDTISVP